MAIKFLKKTSGRFDVGLMPVNTELSGMEITLVNAMSREFTMKIYLNEVKKDYDYILIDCMPSLGMFTINALATADSVIIPVQAHYLSIKGMPQLVRTIEKVQRQINPKLKIEGVLLTLADMKTINNLHILSVAEKNSGNYIKAY